MDKLIIEGGTVLDGAVDISGAKNAVLPILCAALLTDEACLISNVPDLKDVHLMLKILRVLGAQTEFKNGMVRIRAKDIKSHIAPYSLVSRMRASFGILGPLLARINKAKVSLPGGCIIGVRPVDLHIKGLRRLGVDIEISNGYVYGRSKRLRGASVYLGGEFGSSVLATANVLMAAARARGETIIEGAACEPEVADLVVFLNKMGARIRGAGTPTLKIEGVERFNGVEHNIIPDRIEAGTFILAGAITGGGIVIRKAIPAHLSALIDKLEAVGVAIKKDGDCLRVRPKSRLKPVNITTLPYPGFPTDMQAQFMSLLTVIPGVSVVAEKIYPDRFMHIAELNRMGARIQKEGPYAVVEGVKFLCGAPVMASDLRASAALVLAGLASRGKTEITRIYHLDRGYERLDKKLERLGAKIIRKREC
ncbi:MAG: UDP-N-acetylglucosamine 1-carboxyvinyltransferase [Candidatus Omnitrophota bacterium]